MRIGANMRSNDLRMNVRLHRRGRGLGVVLVGTRFATLALGVFSAVVEGSVQVFAELGSIWSIGCILAMAEAESTERKGRSGTITDLGVFKVTGYSEGAETHCAVINILICRVRRSQSSWADSDACCKLAALQGCCIGKANNLPPSALVGL